jgi:Ca2+-binding EF-hand superfamily protein
MYSERASWQDTKKFYLKIFSAIDEDVNGYLSDKEFKKFLISCDIQVINVLVFEIFLSRNSSKLFCSKCC